MYPRGTGDATIPLKPRPADHPLEGQLGVFHATDRTLYPAQGKTQQQFDIAEVEFCALLPICNSFAPVIDSRARPERHGALFRGPNRHLAGHILNGIAFTHQV